MLRQLVTLRTHGEKWCRYRRVQDGSILDVEKGTEMQRQRLGLLVALTFGLSLVASSMVRADEPAGLSWRVGADVNGGGQEADSDPAEGDELDRLLKALEEDSEPVQERPRAAPPPRRRAPEPARAQPAPRPQRQRAPRDPAEALRDTRASQQLRNDESAELTHQAEISLRDQDLLRAEGLLEQARRLDPNNQEAERLYSNVQVLLGNKPGSAAAMIRSLREDQVVQREQARAEVRRLINQAIRHEETQDYTQAVNNYERALEAIRNFPFDLDLGELETQARTRLDRAKGEQRKKEAQEQQDFLDKVNENIKSSQINDLEVLSNQIRELRRKAASAEENERYDRAITLYERILTINPRDDGARRKHHRAKKMRHVALKERYLRQQASTYVSAIVSLEESSVVYQKIFRYPDRKEWLRISPKIASVAERIAASETEHEKEIKRLLGEPYGLSFDETPIQDALDNLAEVSGINFVLTREGAENAADQTFSFESVTELPLRDYLDFLLTAAGDSEAPFNWTIKEGAIVLGPADSLKQREYLYFYEISDLVQAHPDFAAPPIALDELAGKSQATGGTVDFDLGEDDGGELIDRETLLTLIRTELFGEEAEEGETSVALHGGKLSARLDLDKHLKLSKLLDQFRSSTGMMVTVESRFLDIQDNFLEQIGINFGSTASTFLPNSIPDIDGAGKSVSPGFEYVNNEGDFNQRIASIGEFSQPLGTRVNPFNMSASGGGAYQLNVLNVEKYQLEALLTGVAKDQEIRRLNSPRVTAQNGQSAHTLVVNQSAYIQDLEVNQTGVIPVINPVIGILNDGSILEVRPTISHDRRYVVLEVQPTLAEQLDPDVAVLNLSGNFTVVPVELPVLAVTKIKTTVTVPDGGTVLVGGLKREVNNKSAIGLPGFLDVPFLNLLFGARGNSTLRSNLFVLLNAKITIVREEEERLFGS